MKKTELNTYLEHYFLQENVWSRNYEQMKEYFGAKNLGNLIAKFPDGLKLDIYQNSTDGQHWLNIDFNTGEIFQECTVAAVGQQEFDKVIETIEEYLPKQLNR